MFSWICPKCGHEVPPSYSECPNCAPAVKAEPATAAPPPAVPEPSGATAAPPMPPSAVVPPVVASPPPPPLAAAPSLVVPPPAVPPPASSRVAVPGWLLSVMFGLVFIVILLGVIVWRQSRQTPPVAAPSQAAQIAAAETVPTTQPNPELKDLELIGFRLTEDEQQKPFVQFVVVNHSGADLGTLTLKGDLKGIANRGTQTVGSFEFQATLNAYESKDVKVALETKLRVYELPDWQFLRAEITGR